MDDIGQTLNKFIEEMQVYGPQKTGLMQYFKKNYRQILIMKDNGYTTKQITDYMNERMASGSIAELSKPVSVVYFNKAWREFCMKRNIPMKPTAAILQQIESEIFSYRDIVAKAQAAPQVEKKAEAKQPNPTQETALQLAELIKFLLELLRQSTGQSGRGPSKQLQAAAEEVSDLLDEQKSKKTVVPADPDLSSVSKERISAFFDDDA